MQRHTTTLAIATTIKEANTLAYVYYLGLSKVDRIAYTYAYSKLLKLKTTLYNKVSKKYY
jgi:hypothetical protein